MADVTLDPENSNPKELFGQGVRAYVLQDYDTAVRAFSKASELLSAEHGSDIHDSLGDVYLYYGKSLLELSRKESGPLGDGVLKNSEGSESEEVEESEGEEENKDQGTGETEKTEDDKAEKDDESAKNEPVDEKKEEASSSEGNKETTQEEASTSAEAEQKEEQEESTDDLQVAWEVLELAKQIFSQRGEDGRKYLAETLIVLGEVSLECGNFTSAIEDMKEGLAIQKMLFSNDSRTVAETFYKLGGALSTNGQIDEAVDNFNSSLEYLKNKLASLKKDEERKEANAEEIEELESLIPEVQEKIDDMKNLKAEVAKKLVNPVNGGEPSANGTTAAASSSKPVSDISHLVKRKRKGDDDVKDETPAKKPSP